MPRATGALFNLEVSVLGCIGQAVATRRNRTADQAAMAGCCAVCATVAGLPVRPRRIPIGYVRPVKFRTVFALTQHLRSGRPREEGAAKEGEPRLECSSTLTGCWCGHSQTPILALWSSGTGLTSVTINRLSVTLSTFSLRARRQTNTWLKWSLPRLAPRADGTRRTHARPIT